MNDRKPQEIAAFYQCLTLFAFDRTSDDAAYWECEACGAGFLSLHSGFWCRGCGSVFKNPQRFAGSKKRMEVFKHGEKMTFDLREKMLEHGREQQAAWEKRSSAITRADAKIGKSMP